MKITLNELRSIIKQAIQEVALLTEDTINDFFEFLEKDPQKKSFAFAYYTAPYALNKNIVDETGEKVPNPLLGKLYKNTQFQFNYGQTYADAVRKKDPEYEFGKRSGEFEKIQGFDVVETGKNGLYLPIVPLKSKSTYSVNENGDWHMVEYEDIKKYLPVRKPSTQPEGVVQVRQLLVDRIARLSAKGNVWTNPSFKFKYLGPRSEEFV